MKTLHSAIIGLTLFAGAPVAHADVITDWNQTAIEVMKAANVAGNPWTRSMAMMNVAMSDAVNSVQARYTRFSATVPVAPKASAEAAAAAAARQMLVQLYPDQKAKIDEAYALSLKSIPDRAERTEGIALGEQIATAFYAERANDATNVPDTYRPVTSPGVWVPTTPPVFPQYALAKPWGLKSADQFRPGPPPALSSALYARDFNETKDLGGAKSTKRTAEQGEAVRYWTQTNFTPAWFQAAAQVGAARGLSLADNARLFALLAMGLGNCYILEWDAKFHYNTWRPITAIRNGDMDGNDATVRDASWT
ncbi:MAG TPA: vanadium-dependent haloperoxidase, partial [Burkholderiales bacterium]|nr:vanadium-dependent haloperoxidase [Burkholderiales bacterium]